MTPVPPQTQATSSRLLVTPEAFTGRVSDFGYEFLAFENLKLRPDAVFRGETGGRELGLSCWAGFAR